MLGAIIGDIVGSIYEFDNIKSKNFNLFSPACYFTDDTVMTIAIANSLIKCKNNYIILKMIRLSRCKNMENYIQIAVMELHLRFGSI